MSLTVVSTVAFAQSPQAAWAISAAPLVRLGAAATDTNEMFTRVIGATRLPNGNIVVGDRPGAALREFTPQGRLVRQYGMNGGGPGEIANITQLLRCGDSILTADRDSDRISVFTLSGRYVRSFRFATFANNQSPYYTRCGPQGTFAHYGWDQNAGVLAGKAAKSGAIREVVPFWISDRDGRVRRSLGLHPGSERYLIVAEGGMATRPLPFGKQPAIAVGPARIYVGTEGALRGIIGTRAVNRPAVCQTETGPPEPIVGYRRLQQCTRAGPAGLT
jgi:hypothetical protein